MFSNNPIVDLRDLNATSLIFVGDIHGEFGEVLKNINMIPDSLQVYCGDIGMGFYKSGYYSTEFNKIRKRAEKKNAAFAIIIGEDEVNNESIVLKNLKTKEQFTYKFEDFKEEMKNGAFSRLDFDSNDNDSEERFDS